MTAPVPSADATTPSERLAELGLVLPAVPTPAGAYVPAVRDGDLVWTAGQLPLVAGKLAGTGLVGAEITAERAAELARVCALNALAAAASVAGDLDSIIRIVKVVGFVASAPGFVGQPVVLNGASELLGAVFGTAGLHARSAVGVAALPLGAPVEVELVVRVAG
ncbi:RidA family protein [Parafrankia discariae]|uniref:RidA family protein n=1 Tax=Parafrankia discariae TaxID=365528 RepID=UPI000379431F|nr:RidA family protein [Parafrankia discariae]